MFRSRRGFTLIEAVVVLAILAIAAAVAIPTASHYIKLAEFRKNEANAKTAYLAAESVLTWYRTSGEWEDFRAEIIEKGTLNETFAEGDVRAGRIYAVTLNSSQASGRSDSEAQAMTFLENCSYEKDFLNGAIAIEVDVDTGLVYSAFYATRCQELSYAGTDTDGVLDISAREGNRAYDNRKGRLLGYYSAEDVANVVDLKPIQLKVTSINLVNSETLSLNWSSNSRHDNRDVNFHITFYKNEDKTALFSTQVSRSQLVGSGWSGSTENQMVGLALKGADGSDLGTWAFPLLYLEGSSGQNGRFSLILDGMMSASLIESLKDNPSESYAKTSSTSITRLGQRISDLQEPQDIYAVIEAEPDYREMDGDLREYKNSLPVTSNVENTLFDEAKTTGAEGDEKLEAGISRFRHLSNIRYFDETKKAEFTFASRSIDWMAAGAGLYDTVVDGASSQEARKLKWRASLQGEEVLDFPSIPLLSENHTLSGKGSGLISLLNPNASLVKVQLGEESVPGDTIINGIYKDKGEQERPYSRYIGLFGEVEGSIENVTLRDPALELTGDEEVLEGREPEPAEDFGHLYGAGLLCGRSQGKLKDVSVEVTDPESRTVNVYLADRENQGGAAYQRDKNPAGIGGLIGVLARKEENGDLIILTASDSAEVLIEGLSMEGNITAKLPDPMKVSGVPEVEAEEYSYGIGGIFGYAFIGGQVKVVECENHANVTGNLFTGGVGGRVTGDYANRENDDNYTHSSGLRDCDNDGLVLCDKSAARKEEEQELTGRYFGGILGYGSKVEINGSTSASGRSSSYRYMKDGYTEEERERTLLGQYVGGIIGYGNGCHLKGCGTERGGYVLGSDYVGGIAGGLSNDIRQVITGAGTTGNTALTTNAGYVIGNRYVGGIVGKNDGDAQTVVHNCVNNGVVAGYDYCIGGIVGYNGKNGVLENCASYLSDYDHSVYNTVIQNWQAAGACVGGLAGYNNGKIQFENESAATAVKSVSGIVIGANFVGGMVGFNDTEGELDARYELVGGQIHATGTGAGGVVGLNASMQFLKQQFVARPVSVTGQYCTGGIIGANVVDLKQNEIVADLKADNGIGSINGVAFTGGIVGYQRTYTESQVSSVAISSGKQPEGSPLFGYLLAEVEEGSTLEALLPKLGEDGLPTRVMASDNTNVFTITNANNSKDSLEDANNNIPIRGYAYIGGIVGYCERSSKLVLINCKNSAGISRLESAENREGISLKGFLNREGMAHAAQQIEGDPRVYMIGGIIGANMENQVIDHCVNTGNMRGFRGLGGIVGFNAGGVFNCELANNFGNAELDYIGGIAGLNVNADRETGSAVYYTYRDVNGKAWDSYRSGTIAACTTHANRSISGRSYVGGIAGYNLSGGYLIDNTCQASINAAGDYAGGIAGANAGEIQAAKDDGSTTRTVTGIGGQGIGGLAGCNRQTGIISVKDDGSAEEVIAVGSGVTVLGGEKVGGLVGINEGTLKAESSVGGKTVYLTAQAREVRALAGYAGGIAGEASGAGGNITYARNRCTRVTANRGMAGGIVAENNVGMSLSNCQNLGDVNSDAGHAGGIAAVNLGIIENCQVGNEAKTVTINSFGVEETGVVCAVNQGEIRVVGDDLILSRATLTGNARKAGGVVGANEGTISGTGSARISSMPKISLSGGGLTIGGIAGENRGQGLIQEITADGLKFDGFRNYRYLGGIVGENKSTVVTDEKGQLKAVTGVKNCSFVNGTVEEGSSAVGNCYGGIAGINSGLLTDCEIKALTLDVTGVYTATSTSTAREKEAASTHVGGVAGKNEEGAVIIGCFISNDGNSQMNVANGMAGGIAGYNKGTIRLSGDASTKNLMDGVGYPDSEEAFDQGVKKLRENTRGLLADDYVKWNGTSGAELEAFPYNGTNQLVNENRNLSLIMTTNGNLGGITAYNAPSGALDRCATGNWYLNNKSDAIGVGTGGIIGMNESKKDQSFLLNQAFVGRQLGGNGASDRFAGGIIGNQNNTTSSGWKIQGCINYGMVYCLRAHYSGGILGQWTGTGGTIEKCYNYGNLQTSHNTGWKGASAGIVAQLYHAYENNEYNIISCGNYGSIYLQNGETGAGANDSAGILGNITAYLSSGTNAGQDYKIRVLDCVNGSGVKIYSASMASGIVGFFSCDKPSNANLGYDPIANATGKIKLRIERCRNFAEILKGQGGGSNNFSSGIFGERYGSEGSGNTTLKDCYSVNRPNSYYSAHGGQNYPIISYSNNTNEGQYQNSGKIKAANNYYIDESKVTHATGEVADIVANLKRAATARAFIITKDSKEYLAYLKPDNDINVSSLTLTGDKLYSGTTEMGQILFEIPHTGQHNNMAEEIVKKKNDFDDHVREAYHKLEGAEKVTSESQDVYQMKKPVSVVLTTAGNKANLTVTPAAGTDPFKYKATLYLGNRILRELEFYSEDYTIALSAQETILASSGQLKAAVSACSMFDDVKDSPSIDSGTQQIAKVLPDPSIRIELVRDGKGGHTYRFWLDNIEDYKDFQPQSGTNALWKIQINGGAVEIEPKWNATAGAWEADTLCSKNSDVLASPSLQQLLVQAVPLDGTLLPSTQVSVPVYLPKYTPSMSLVESKQNNGDIVLYAKPSVVVSGDNLTNLSITVTLTATGTGNVTTPPIYRVDLIGTWNDGKGNETKNAVIQSTDILASANGSVSAVFDSLPEYMSWQKGDRLPYVTDLKVRVWYAQSGLGPVYTYDSAAPNNGNITLLDKVEKLTAQGGAETITPIWGVMDSPVLDGTTAFEDYRATLPSGNTALFEWIKAPNLEKEAELRVDAGAQQDRLQYTFKWDQGTGEYVAGDTYIVSLVGINESGGEVSIVTNQEVKGNQLQADAEDWSYQTVKLTVTRRGEEGKKIGLTASKEYEVKQRLPRPAQPMISNPNTNELDYMIEWTPIVPDTGCDSYEIYVQPYKADGILEKAELVKTVNADTKNEAGIYSTTLPMEDFAGKKVLVYLVAQPKADDPQYVQSVDGVTYELEVPSRIAEPTIDRWGKSWEYRVDSAISAEAFRGEGNATGGLSVNVEPQTAPPGDSSYLLKAYVFDSKEKADSVKEMLKSDNNEGLEDLDGYLAVYPGQTGSTLIPAAMDPVNSLNYRHTLRGLSAEYAGKWILFYARVSSGNGQISSKWVVNPDVWQLPYVKLQDPKLRSGNRKLSVDAKNMLNPDIPKEEKWNADHKAVTWNSVELADTYYMTLKPKNGLTSTVSEQRFRIQEDGSEVTVSVAQADGSWIEITGGKAADVYTFELGNYSMEVSGSYQNSSGLTIPYIITANAKLEAAWEEGTGFHYTLILPDADSVETADGSTISEVNLRPTASVVVYADVKENDPDKSVAVKSTAYIWSEDVSLDFAN